MSTALPEDDLSTDVVEDPEMITKRIVTSLDRWVQVLEISFIFLITFSLIALVEAVATELDWYNPISNDFLGRDNVGPLDGGNFEAIVRITLVFNLLLFVFSLIFGLWMRRTRDNWTWEQMGYTLKTEGYSFVDLVRRGFILGLIAIVVFYIARAIILVSQGAGYSIYHTFSYSTSPEFLYTNVELNSELYFGIVEMGFIWPLSAGFFFFAYAHNSLNAKFPTGIANSIATLFYVFYLQFFFLISGEDKLNQYFQRIIAPQDYIGFWVMTVALLINLYIAFSAFAETKSIVLPFILNFVWNVGITIIQAGNTIIYDEVNPLMAVPFVAILIFLALWWYIKPDDFSTLRSGFNQLKDVKEIDALTLLGYLLVFIMLSFIMPGAINELLYLSRIGYLSQDVSLVVPILYAINYVLLIILAVYVLTYDPTEVFDVLLVSQDGTPIASQIELFETDEVLISGFFTALSAVDKELSTDGGLRTIQRGQRDILIEEGVYTRVIALADRDQPSIRQTIANLHRNFEIQEGEKINQNKSKPSEYKEANELVKKISDLSLRFAIPPQTKWISTISLCVGPIMIILIGILGF